MGAAPAEELLEPALEQMSRSMLGPCSAALLGAEKATPCSSRMLPLLLPPGLLLLLLKLQLLLMLPQLLTISTIILHRGCCSCKAM